MLAEEVVIRPVITESSNEGLAMGKYTFEVAKKATKIQIREAIEKLFEVKVLKVNTMIIKGKKKRVGVHQGYTSDWKKAIVSIDTNPKEKTYLDKKGKVVTNTKKYKDSIEGFMA